MSEKDINLQQDQDIIDISELINPFPGLRPFGVEEGHLFFGREGQSDEVLVKLQENKFIGILGASGSGKSSFMYCGLVPSLNGGFMSEAGSNWRVVVARPGGGPIDNLAEALLIKNKDYNNLSDEDKLIKKTIIGTVLRSSSLGLVEVIRQLKTDDGQNLLIVIDQFEELFRFRKLEAATSDMDESSAFVNLLLEAVHQFDEPIYVTITMRSDFIGECAKFPDLTQMINDSHYLIPQMTRDQKRTAIEGPVAVGGGKIAPRLTQQLLNDVGDNPDQLPILQHALMRTWAFWVENRKIGEPVDLRHYNSIGTLREALSQHANEAYDSLSKREKQIAEVMFKSLTERGSENQGIRRPTKLGTISAIAGVAEDEVIRVVDKFREPGRSLLMPPHGVRLESESVVDISHESLMRIWDRLKRWLDEESKAAEMYIKLSEAAERFQEGKASLWKMPDLQLALNWKEENRPTLIWGQRYNPAFERTLVFLETSEKAYITEQRNKELLQKRGVKRMRITALVLGAAAVVSIFLVVFSQIKMKEADKATADAKVNLIAAEEAAENAKIQEGKASKEAARAVEAETDAEQKAKQATEAGQRAEAAAADALKQKDLADIQSALAKESAAEAEKQTEEAKKAQAQAQNQQKLAEEASATAQKLRFQSVASSMAIKSTKINNDKELKAVVAKQAYDYFNDYRDESKQHNADIYAGVYAGLAGLLARTDLVIRKEKGDTLEIPRTGNYVLNQFVGHLPEINPETGEERQVAVRSVAFNNDGTTMYSAGSDGKLLKWDMTKDERLSKVIYSQDHVNRVVDLSPNERYLALGTDDKHIMLIDLKKIDEEQTIVSGHIGGTIYDLVFIPGGTKEFISVGADNRILWHKSNTTIEITKTKAKTLAISPDARFLAVGNDDGDVKLFDLTEPEFDEKFLYIGLSKEDNTKGEEIKQNPINALTFNNSGNRLAFGDTKGNLIIWDVENKKQDGFTLTGFESPITDVKFSPNDKLIAASSRDKTVRMWDRDNIYDLPTVFDDHGDWVWSIDFHPEGNYFITGAADGIIRKFNVLPDEYASQICGLISGNMNNTEWLQYVGEGIDLEETCEGLVMRENAK